MSTLEKLTRRIDWVGNLFFAGATSVLTMALTFGGTSYTWQSASEIVLWVLSGVLYLAFSLSQWFHPLIDKQFRLFPTDLVRQTTLVLLQISSFMAAFGLLVRTIRMNEYLPFHAEKAYRFQHTTYRFSFSSHGYEYLTLVTAGNNNRILISSREALL